MDSILPNNNDSYIRVLHAVPNAPAVDVYANDELIAKKLPYKRFTQYMKVPAVEYTITIYPAGTKEEPVLETTIPIKSNSIYTLAAIGLLPQIDVLPVEEPPMVITPGEVCVRAAHLSPDAPPVDVTLPDGSVLFEDVSYEEVTDYFCIEPGGLTLQLRLPGTDQVILTVPNIQLRPNRFYTFYVVGEAENMTPLQMLIPLDGNSYIKVE